MVKFTMLALVLFATCSSAIGYEVELDNRPLVLPITEELGWFKHLDEDPVFSFSIASMDFPYPLHPEAVQSHGTGFDGMMLAN